MSLIAWVQKRIVRWLEHEKQTGGSVLCDFDLLSYEIRPCDVLLVEGQSRVSEVIKTITQTNWTHAALYLGRLHDIKDPGMRAIVKEHYQGEPGEQLLIEALLGRGTIITPLSRYKGYHLRICRPKGLIPNDVHQVLEYAIRHTGTDYDVRHLLDLARFLFPYGIVPRRWRSSLFEHNAGIPTRTVCSSMIAACFAQVHFPILPVVRREKDGHLSFFKRNTRLFIPRDFDYSPYFEIIKYPMLGADDLTVYRQLPWSPDGLVCNDVDDCFVPQPEIPGEEPIELEAADTAQGMLPHGKVGA